jgi:uncharacterized membrane protein YeiH
MTEPPLLTLLLTTLEATATIAFALSGLLEAARKRLDAVGVCVVAGLAAFGGGTLRDVLLDRRPFFWVEHAAWLWALLGLCVAAMALLRARHFAPTERAMQWPDALGLGLFSAGGTQLALAQGLPAIVAVLMGVVTATFGGVLRDIVCNEIPSAFRDHRPYAVCAFVGGWVVVAAEQAQVAGWIGLAAGAVVATALRILALVFDWRLPAWSSQGILVAPRRRRQPDFFERCGGTARAPRPSRRPVISPRPRQARRLLSLCGGRRCVCFPTRSGSP